MSRANLCQFLVVFFCENMTKIVKLSHIFYLCLLCHCIGGSSRTLVEGDTHIFLQWGGVSHPLLGKTLITVPPPETTVRCWLRCWRIFHKTFQAPIFFLGHFYPCETERSQINQCFSGDIKLWPTCHLPVVETPGCDMDNTANVSLPP